MAEKKEISSCKIEKTVIQSHSNREYTRGKPQKCGFSKAKWLVHSNRFLQRRVRRI